VVAKPNRNSANNESYNNMTRVMPGDVVYAFADAAIRTVGIALARAYEAPKPAEFGVVDVGDEIQIRTVAPSHSSIFWTSLAV